MQIKLIKILIVLYFTIGVIYFSNGQGVETIPPSVPTSPQADAFMKYGDYSINYSTGIPDISIPLFEINHGSYNLPVSLNYYPQPLKPGYNYDVWGHGWGFSVSSCVSRSIEYNPDEWSDFKLQPEYMDDYFASCPQCINNYNYAYDKFNVKLPSGRSFDFVIRNVSGQLEYICSEGSGIKISCIYTSSNISTFTIIDEMGIKYTFAGADTPYEGGESGFNASYVSWQLTQIDLPNSQTPIVFNYNQYVKSPYPVAFEEPGILITESLDHLNYTTTHVATIKDALDAQPYNYKMKLLSSISYGGNSILINYKDQNSTSAHNYASNLQLKNGSTLVKQVDLNMSIETVRGFGMSYPLAKLESVSIKGSDLSNEMLYSCVYNTISWSFSGTDHWGNLNTSGTKYDVGNFNLFVSFDIDHFGLGSHSSRISRPTKTADELCPYDKLKLAYSNYNYRQPSTPELHGVISRLYYPTKGYTDFKFENHEFLTSTDLNGNYIHNKEDRIKAKASGFRISKISNYKSNGELVGTKDFRYGERKAGTEMYTYFHTGVGEAVVDPNVLTYMNHTYSFYGNYSAYGYPFVNMILGLSPEGENVSFINPLSTTWMMGCTWRWECNFTALNFRKLLNGRPPVVYPEVTVYDGNIGNNSTYTPENTTGKTVYEYDILEPDMYGNEVVCEPIRYFGNTLSYEPKKYLYGKLVKKEVFRLVYNHFYDPVQRDEFEYYPNYRSYQEYQFTNAYPNVSGYYPTWVYVNEFFMSKSGYLGTNQLLTKISTRVTETGSTEVRIGYSYNSENLVIREAYTNSAGKLIETKFRYPKDINSGVYASMKSLNMLNYPVEKTEFANSSVLASRLTTYKSNSGSYVPDKVYALETTSPLSSFTAFNGSTMDSHYNSSKPEVKFEYYDSKGNPTQITSKDGITTSYLWDATGNYLMAKVDDATYSQISSLNGKVCSYSSSTLFSSLKSLVPGAMISTYSYKPLIGLSAATDQNGVTHKYDYDSIGRLHLIKNDDDHIQSRYNYNYKN